MRRRKPSVVCELNVMDSGDNGKVVEVIAVGPMRHRIFSLGLVEGTAVVVKGRNPLRKSISVFVRNRNLELYEELAKNILVRLEQ